MDNFTSNVCKIDCSDPHNKLTLAVKSIKQGELIIQEKPLIIGPIWGSALCCLNCYGPSMTICKKCSVCPLCLDCMSHDDFECSFFIDLGMEHNFLLDHFDIVMPLRCIALWKKQDKSELFEQFMALSHNLDNDKRVDYLNYYERKIIKVIHNEMKLEPILLEKFNDQVLRIICCIMDANSFEVRSPAILKGYQTDDIVIRALYLKASLLTHSCVSNTFLSIDSNYELRIHASSSIRADETVSYNYTNPLSNTEDRKQQMRDRKNFNCTCPRCEDPTELGTHGSSFLCSKCIVGTVVFSKNDFIWKCQQCFAHLSNETKISLIDQLRKDIDDANSGKIKNLEKIIEKYSTKFHTNHGMILECKQKLVALYKIECQDNTKMVKVQRKFLQKTWNLLKDIEAVVVVLLPGISRLKGFLWYEMFSTSFQLAHRNYNSSISKLQYLDNLKEAEQKLKQCISMLIYEPSASPEGQLVKRALFELKELRKNIEEIQHSMSTKQI